MALKVDTRPFKVDWLAHPDRDADSILIEDFLPGYLDDLISATAPIRQLGTTTSTGVAWTVTVDEDAPSITLSLPQADLATLNALGMNTFDWVLLLTLADGTKPPLVGGALYVTRDERRSNTNTTASVGITPTLTISLTQVLTSISAIDGGTFAATGTEGIDGGDW